MWQLYTTHHVSNRRVYTIHSLTSLTSNLSELSRLFTMKGFSRVICFERVPHYERQTQKIDTGQLHQPLSGSSWRSVSFHENRLFGATQSLMYESLATEWESQWVQCVIDCMTRIISTAGPVLTVCGTWQTVLSLRESRQDWLSQAARSDPPTTCNTDLANLIIIPLKYSI